MKVNLDLTATAPENLIEDELHTDVGAPVFNIDHDLFFGEEIFEIWTAAGQTGTQLIQDTDFQLTGISPEYSSRAGRNVYSTVLITNPTYQSGDIYFTYQACGDFVDADDRYQVVRSDGQYWNLTGAGGFEVYSTDAGANSINFETLGEIQLTSQEGISIQDDSGAEILISSAGAASVKALAGQQAFLGDTTSTTKVTVTDGKIAIVAADTTTDSVVIQTSGGIDVDSAIGINIQDKYFGTGPGSGITIQTDIDNAAGTGSDITIKTTLVTGTPGGIDIDSGSALSLKDEHLSSSIPLSESGTTGLSGFTATSIVGALNETAVESIPVGGTTNQVLTKDTATDFDTSWQDIPAVEEVPAGGTINQVLTKDSATDYDTSWQDIEEVPAGGTIDQVLTKDSAADYDTSWQDAGGLPAGGILNDVLVKQSSTDGDASWDQGSGSGIDADKLDGIEGADLVPRDSSTTINDSATAMNHSYLLVPGRGIPTSDGDQSPLEVYQSTTGADAFMQFHVGGDYACFFGLDGGTNKLSVGGWSMGANSYEIYHSGNPPPASTPANGSITQVKLKTSIGSVSTTSTTVLHYTLPGGTYGFYPQFRNAHATRYATVQFAHNNKDLGTTYKTNIAMSTESAGTVYAQQRYVTSSGEVYWYFFLKQKSDGKIISGYQAPDHPCFGNGGDDTIVPHPFPEFDEALHEIVVVNPTMEQAKEIFIRGTETNKDPLEIIEEEYLINDINTPLYPEVDGTAGYVPIPITIGLDRVESFPFFDETEAIPLKKVLTRPEFIQIKKFVTKM